MARDRKWLVLRCKPLVAQGISKEKEQPLPWQYVSSNTMEMILVNDNDDDEDCKLLPDETQEIVVSPAVSV